MMRAVMRRPPQRSFLRSRLRKKGKDKLKYAAGLVSAMREVTMVATGHGKNAHDVEHDAANHCFCSNARPKCAQYAEMDDDKRNHARQVVVARRAINLDGGGLHC